MNYFCSNPFQFPTSIMFVHWQFCIPCCHFKKIFVNQYCPYLGLQLVLLLPLLRCRIPPDPPLWIRDRSSLCSGSCDYNLPSILGSGNSSLTLPLMMTSNWVKIFSWFLFEAACLPPYTALWFFWVDRQKTFCTSLCDVTRTVDVNERS